MSPKKARRNIKSLASLNESELLSLRLSDLRLSTSGTHMETCLDRLYRELEEKRLHFLPQVWISTDWFTPEGVPGFAAPFYLMHPKLLRLHRKMGLETEGDTLSECMKILRHEAGHAIEHAFQLRRRKERQRIFGKSTTPYPEYYVPAPGNKRYVLNLDSWYAQSHPDEDFAETFAVWLDPKSNWEKCYRNWAALKKLKYMSELMGEIAGKKPLRAFRKEVEPLSEFSITLGDLYQAIRKKIEKSSTKSAHRISMSYAQR